VLARLLLQARLRFALLERSRMIALPNCKGGATHYAVAIGLAKKERKASCGPYRTIGIPLACQPRL